VRLDSQVARLVEPAEDLDPLVGGNVRSTSISALMLATNMFRASRTRTVVPSSLLSNTAVSRSLRARLSI
jgi:hypothetical protein